MEKLTGEKSCQNHQMMEAWMSLRLVIVHSTAGSTAKTMAGRNYQTTENLRGWNIPPSANAFRASDNVFAPSFRNGGAMRGNPYERGFPEGDLLNAEARAVIDADFEEITAGHQPRSFMQLMKDMFQWIKQRLQRA
ncbi:MAG: hypothetical protein SFX19_04455 [Alphaproteobacteria bacterium]|nr:hypothetical protein [Alphaproteobacteria bacterium]